MKRSLNENELLYQANLTSEGFHPRVPLQVFWVMKTSESGHEELTNMERNRAYGIDLLRVDPHEVRFTVKALAGVKFRATESSDESGSRVTTTAEVDGKEISLREVFISTKGRGLFLRVLSIDFSGIEPETGAAVTRRITLRR